MEEMTAFQRNTERAIERYRQEGMELEKARSAEHERSLLARQASRRFGATIGRRLGTRLADVNDPAVFDRVGDLVVDCATGEELLGGIDEIPAADL